MTYHARDLPRWVTRRRERHIPTIDIPMSDIVAKALEHMLPRIVANNALLQRLGAPNALRIRLPDNYSTQAVQRDERHDERARKLYGRPN